MPHRRTIVRFNGINQDFVDEYLSPGKGNTSFQVYFTTNPFTDVSQVQYPYKAGIFGMVISDTDEDVVVWGGTNTSENTLVPLSDLQNTEIRIESYYSDEGGYVSGYQETFVNNQSIWRVISERGQSLTLDLMPMYITIDPKPTLCTPFKEVTMEFVIE